MNDAQPMMHGLGSTDEAHQMLMAFHWDESRNSGHREGGGLYKFIAVVSRKRRFELLLAIEMIVTVRGQWTQAPSQGHDLS